MRGRPKPMWQPFPAKTKGSPGSRREGRALPPLSLHIHRKESPQLHETSVNWHLQLELHLENVHFTINMFVGTADYKVLLSSQPWLRCLLHGGAAGGRQP